MNYSIWCQIICMFPFSLVAYEGRWESWIEDVINFPYQLIGESIYSEVVLSKIECAVLCTAYNCSMFEFEEETNVCNFYSGVAPGTGTQPFSGGPRTVYKRESNCELSGYVYDKEGYLCFNVCQEEHTWVEASESCEQDGGRLLILNSTKQIEVVLKHIYGLGYTKYWIGLSDRDQEGQWYWINGSPFTPDIWNNVAFNNYDSLLMVGADFGVDCGRINLNGDLSDWCCERTSTYICEKPHLVSGQTVY